MRLNRREAEEMRAMAEQVMDFVRESIREGTRAPTRRVVFAQAAEIAAAEHVDELTKARARALLDRAGRRRRKP